MAKMGAYLAEFLGAFVLMYTILATSSPLAIGAALALMVLVTAKISGGHLNPMVSIVMGSAGKLPINDVVPYILSQILGGMVALEVYKRYKLLA